MKKILTCLIMVLLISGCETQPHKPPTPPIDTDKIVELGNPNSPQKALVIGISQYEYKALNHPMNDATDMANFLVEMDFHVIRAFDLKYKEMEAVLDDFHQLLTQTQADVDKKVGLFYFSGHGARYNRDQNYLIPTNNRKISRNSDLKDKAFHLKTEIMTPLKQANKGVNIIVADACRDNPYKSSQKRGDDKRGLKLPALQQGPIGALVAFAASPGETADDGDQRNGLYTKHLLAQMRDLKNKPIEKVFRQVREPVAKDSQGNQNPSYVSTLLKKYCIGGC
jgi:uncharacterized caspase-like protein